MSPLATATVSGGDDIEGGSKKCESDARIIVSVQPESPSANELMYTGVFVDTVRGVIAVGKIRLQLDAITPTSHVLGKTAVISACVHIFLPDFRSSMIVRQLSGVWKVHLWTGQKDLEEAFGRRGLVVAAATDGAEVAARHRQLGPQCPVGEALAAWAVEKAGT